MRFVTSNYYEGISSVVVEHMGETFIDYALIHPDDKDTESEFFGCGLAEMRAKLKALKYERKIYKARADECKRFVKACETYKTWDKESPVARAVYRQLNRRIITVNRITDRINDLIEAIEQKKQSRDIVVRAIQRHKDKREKTE